MKEKAKVTIDVVKTVQSPTTPVVALEYNVKISSEFLGNGIFDAEDLHIIQLILLLEGYNKDRIGLVTH